MHKVIYTEHARHDLKRLQLKVARKILEKIYFFSQQKNPLSFAKKLKNPDLGQYRFRIGDYRALFDVDKNGRILILIILKIKHRKDVYNL